MLTKTDFEKSFLAEIKKRKKNQPKMWKIFLLMQYLAGTSLFHLGGGSLGPSITDCTTNFSLLPPVFDVPRTKEVFIRQ